MAMNRVQFQPGLSMPEFLQQFGTEAQCEAALQAARWPGGFVCPNRGGAARIPLRATLFATGNVAPAAISAA
jgi:hypothetical protein